MNSTSYAGNGRPFVFAMFAPEDAAAAETALAVLREKGYELWPGERFDKRRIDKSALVLLFLSPAAAANEAVNRVINYTAQKDHAMLAIYLAPTALSPAQRLMLNTQQGILRYDCTDEAAFSEKLFGCALLQNLQVTPAQKRAASLTTWGISAGVLAAAAVAVGLALSLNAAVPEDSLIAELGYTGRMASITGIYLYGDRVLQEQGGPSIKGYLIDYNTSVVTEAIYFSDTNQSAPFGEINDISDFTQLGKLKGLSLAGNRVSDISAIVQLRDLEYLDLTGNPVASLDGVGELARLETLCIGSTQIADLSPLDACKNLKQVYVDQTQYHKFSAQQTQSKYKLILFGPKEEICGLSVHIFGGPEENGGDYGVFVQTITQNVYDDYTFEFWKNDKKIAFSSIENVSSFNNGISEKLHLFPNQAAFGAYDPTAEYRLVVRYEGYSATYRIWHKYDSTGGSHVGSGKLIESGGF